MRRPTDLTRIAREIRAVRHANYLNSLVPIFRVCKNGELSKVATVYVRADEVDSKIQYLERVNPGKSYRTRQDHPGGTHSTRLGSPLEAQTAPRSFTDPRPGDTTMTTTINTPATKTYAHKHDAKRAAIKVLGDHPFELVQIDGRWTYTWEQVRDENDEQTEDQASVETDSLDEHEDHESPADSINAQQRKVANLNAKAQAKADRKSKKGKNTKKEKVDRGPTFAAQVIAAAKKGQKIDKEFVKKVLGDIDDKKARRIARQVNRSR